MIPANNLLFFRESPGNCHDLQDGSPCVLREAWPYINHFG